MKNCNGMAVTCKNKFEIKFVNFCNENNIEILNGPLLQYTIGSAPTTFRVGFELPVFGYLVDLVENKVRFVNSSKKMLKHEAIVSYCEANSKHYHCIYQYNYIKFTRSLLKSLTAKSEDEISDKI
jgi:hypothetical protein